MTKFCTDTTQLFTQLFWYVQQGYSLTCFLADLVHIRTLFFFCKLKSFVLSLSGGISRPMAYMESEVLNPISHSNYLVVQVLDIFICRDMNKVAWIVQFKQSQLEIPHVAVFAVMSIRSEIYHQRFRLLLENMKAEII